MLTRDSISGLICLAMSLWLLLLSVWLPPAAMVPIGPAFYPRVVLLLTTFQIVHLIAFDVIAGRRPPAAQTPAVAAPPPNYRLVLATFIEFGLYIALLPPIGFRIATFLFVIALQATLDWPRGTKNWLLAIAVAVATSLVCHYVFETYLSVLLPRGTWSQM
jgi:hypothetical protein